MRHEAQRDGELGVRRGAIDAWEKELLANRMLTQDAGWYTDNGKYRQLVALVFGEWNKGQKEVCRGARKTVEAQPRGGEEGKEGQAEGNAGSGAMEDVAALHSKFFQDPTFGGRKGKFADVDAFDAGIERQVRPNWESQHQNRFQSFEKGGAGGG